MAYQTNSRILVAIKRETTIGTAATAASAQQMRIVDSPGLELSRAIIQSQEKRSDALKDMGRLGGNGVDGSYNFQATVGGATDILLEAIMRSTWAVANAITVDGTAPKTSFTVDSTSQFTYIGTSTLLALGLRVGDVCTFTNMSTAANNDIRLRIATINAAGLVVTVAGTPLTVQTADAAATLTIMKKLTTPATPTRYSHTIEQYDAETGVDLTELFLGCRLVGLDFSFKPGQMATYQATFMGLDRTQLVTGTSPWFTTPTLTTGLALIADDSAIRYNGADVASFTGCDLSFKIAGSREAVIGSFVSPDIADGDLEVSASISALRSDFANLTLFGAETEFELSILLQEPAATGARPAIGLHFSRVKIVKLNAPVGGGDGFKKETLSLMVGPKVAATGYDGGIASIFSSAA